jgi:hypothetical protein
MRSRCCPCACVYLCVCVSPLSLLDNGSVKVPLSLLGNGEVFYAVRVVSEESRRLVLPRISCFIYIYIIYMYYIVYMYEGFSDETRSGKEPYSRV